MKKILATIVGVAVAASVVHAQGFLQLSSGAVFNVTTNTGTFGNTSVANAGAGYNSIVSGKTFGSAANPNAFDYTLLFIPTGVGTSGDLANLADGNWVQLAVDLAGSAGPLIAGTNVASPGNWAMQGGANSQQVIGSGGQAFANGTSYSLALVGWSANLGSSWSQVEALYAQNFGSSPSGFFGSTIATVNPNPAAPGNTAVLMWGNGSLTLYSTPVPEPATLALAGLGGLSLLFLRRRKS